MKTWLQKLFSEDSGVSMVRLLSLICTVAAVAIAFIGMYTDKHTLEAVAILCGTFLTAGVGGKIAQKYIEKGAENEEK